VPDIRRRAEDPALSRDDARRASSVQARNVVVAPMRKAMIGTSPAACPLQSRRQKGFTRMKYLNLAAALTICVVNVLLVSVPLAGLMALPSLLASVGWASRALQALPIDGGRRVAGTRPLEKWAEARGVSHA
jgi:hypothetical protein